MRKLLTQVLVAASFAMFAGTRGATSQTPVATQSSTPATVGLGSGSPPQTSPPTANTPMQKNGSGVYTVKSSARLVVLDVVVTDKKGNIVDDLKRDDFTVTEAGEPQTILNFETAGGHTVAPDVTINSTADLDRLARAHP